MPVLTPVNACVDFAAIWRLRRSPFGEKEAADDCADAAINDGIYSPHVIVP
jgi:hypothetical protein